MFRTPYWEHVTQRVFSYFLATFRATIGSMSQQTLRTAVYSRDFCGCVGPQWKQIVVKRWGFVIPRWNLPGLLFTWWKGKMYWIPGIFCNFCGRLKLQGISKKIPLLYLRKNVLATAGNLRVNEQTKYKSVPIFLLFIAVERKPEIRNYWIFEPAI